MVPVEFEVYENLLFGSGWISAIVTQFHAVEVQAGEEVTLECSNSWLHILVQNDQQTQHKLHLVYIQC